VKLGGGAAPPVAGDDVADARARVLVAGRYLRFPAADKAIPIAVVVLAAWRQGFVELTVAIVIAGQVGPLRALGNVERVAAAVVFIDVETLSLSSSSLSSSWRHRPPSPLRYGAK